MTDQFTGQQRAERAFEAYLADQAKDADFPPLDPAALTQRRPAPRRWRPVLVAAAAALAVVAAGIGIHRAVTGGMPAEPAQPAGKGVWQRTSPIPLGQRYGSVNLWADGAFFLIGGNPHCGLDEQGRELPGAACRASLPSLGAPLADGARYDPAQDSWQRIADAPVPLGRGSQGVVVGDRLYLASEPGESDSGSQSPTLLEYDPVADTWTKLAQPADSLQVVALLSWQDGLYATVAEPGCLEVGCAQSIQRWDPTTAAWQRFAPSHPAIGHGLIAATKDGFAAVTDSTVAVFSGGTWTELTPTPELPLTAAGQLTWAAGDPRSDLVTVLTWDGQAYLLRLGEATWQAVAAPPQGQGGLIASDELGTPRFSDGRHVVVAGQLYDPVEATWTNVPPLPNPRWTFGEFASSGSQLLACYDVGDSSYNDCYLLTPEQPTPPQPPAPTGQWRTVAPSPLEPRGTSIASWVGHEYLIVGGAACTGQASADPASNELDCTRTPALDAAAYDPATDRWRTIAAPPLPGLLDWSSSWAVLNDVLYLGSMEPAGMWSYDPAADRWQELPLPPGGVAAGETVSRLVALNDVLLAVAGPGGPDAWFDPATGAWTELPAGTYPNGVYPNEATRQVVFTGKELVIGEPTVADNGDLTLRISVFEPDDDGRLFTRPSALRPAVVAASRLVATGSGTIATLPAEGRQSFYRTGGGEEWLPVPASGQPSGALRPGLVAGDTVVLDGNLFGPQTGSWRTVELPAGLTAGGFVQAGGPEGILFCFGLDEQDELTDGCYLRPS